MRNTSRKHKLYLSIAFCMILLLAVAVTTAKYFTVVDAGSFSLTVLAKKNPVTEISVTAAPDKTVYIVGDAFDSTGMVITATYLNGDTKIIDPEAYVLSDHTDLALGQSTVTITYTEEEVTKTVDIPLTVIAEEFTVTYMVDGGAFTDGTTQIAVVIPTEIGLWCPASKRNRSKKC